MRHFLCQGVHFLLPLAAFANVCTVRGSKALLQRCVKPVSKGGEVTSGLAARPNRAIIAIPGRQREIEMFLLCFSGKAEGYCAVL